MAAATTRYAPPGSSPSGVTNAPMTWLNPKKNDPLVPSGTAFPTVEAATQALVDAYQARVKQMLAAGQAAPTARTRPADAVTLGYAIPRGSVIGGNGDITPADLPAPPDVNTNLTNPKQAVDAATRMRRRAAAGSAGKVTTGPLSLLQQGIQAALTPRALIGG